MIDLDVAISKVSKARTNHPCAYCKGEVKPGEWYIKFTIRKKHERFPKAIAVCKEHKPELIPLSVIINEKI
jgi:hypothetical protein